MFQPNSMKARGRKRPTLNSAIGLRLEVGIGCRNQQHLQNDIRASTIPRHQALATADISPPTEFPATAILLPSSPISAP